MIKQSKEVLTADFPPRKVIFHTAAHAPYILNGTASLIWDFCKTPKDENEIITYLRRTYGITATQAKRDTMKFIKELKKKDIIETHGRKR